MATVTMELAELDMLKRNAKETEQKLNEKISELQNQNAQLINNAKKILVTKRSTHTKLLLPHEYFYTGSSHAYSTVAQAIRNGESIYLFGQEYIYAENLKAFVSNSTTDECTESKEFIGFEEAKEQLESSVIYNLKKDINLLKETNFDLEQTIKKNKKEKNKEIDEAVKNLKEQLHNQYERQLNDKSDTIEQLEKQLKAEKEKFSQYKAKVEKDEERMAKDDLIEKLRKEIGELKQQLSDKPVKKSWFQKVFSPNMED